MMKRYVVATLIVIGAHILLELLWSPYLDLLADCGGFLIHGNDIGDIPGQLLLGNVIVGVLLIGLTNASVALVNMRRRR
jgi:hypothetical protein